jgi:hypothetical protein
MKEISRVEEKEENQNEPKAENGRGRWGAFPLR